MSTGDWCRVVVVGDVCRMRIGVDTDVGNRAIERCTFDQARLIRHNRILAKNGIAPDGK